MNSPGQADYPELNSPLFATKNADRKQINKKDSCVDFKLGKENLLTGKTEPVSGSVHTKLSGINFDGLKSPALVSKFAQKKWFHYTTIFIIFYVQLFY